MSKGKWIDRIDKWGVWVLLILILLYMVSGYGITKNIFDPVLCRYIHGQLLPIPFIIFFMIHVLRSVHRQFKNWDIFKDPRVLNAYVYLLGTIIAGLFLWLYFR